MSDIKNTFANVASSIGKTSKKLVKTTKLNLAINSEESRLKTVYCDIGKKVHEIYSFGGKLGEFFDAKYAEILEAEAKIADLRNQLCAANGIKVCAKCGKNVDISSDFCPKCGSDRFNEFIYKPLSERAESEPDEERAEPESEPVTEPEKAAEAEPKKKLCPQCGCSNEFGDKFCMSCGRLI
jgi:RNA polymerase subunit RPABC4/transcription elongation factor Spt4